MPQLEAVFCLSEGGIAAIKKAGSKNEPAFFNGLICPSRKRLGFYSNQLDALP